MTRSAMTRAAATRHRPDAVRSRGRAALGAAALGVLVFGGGALLGEPSVLAGRAMAAPDPGATAGALAGAAGGATGEPDGERSARPDRQRASSVWQQLTAQPPQRPGQPDDRDDPAGAPVAATQPPAASAPPDSGAGTAPERRPGTIVLPEGGTASLVRAEVDRNGTLPVPDGVAEATWWGVGLGARSGATVFAGHVNYAGATGPFAELWSASRGDRVAVVDGTGRTRAFRMQQVLTVSKHDLPKHAERLFGPTGKPRVVLVTCGGRWVGGQNGYESNRIVVATPAG